MNKSIEPERELPYRAFSGVRFNSPDDELLVEALKLPTMEVAGLHLLVNPNLWYGRVYSHSFKDPEKIARFASELKDRAVSNPELLNPYTMIDSNWQAVPITEDPKIKSSLNVLGRKLEDAAHHVNRFYSRRGGSQFAHYLNEEARFLPKGEFDEAMISVVHQDPSFPINWGGLPVEPYNDPLKIKSSFQGWITYSNPGNTAKANSDIQKARKVALEIYGDAPRDAKVFVSKAVVLSGYLGEIDRSQVAFNIPNSSEVGEIAGNDMIMILEGRVADKNDRYLSPVAMKYLNFHTTTADIINTVQFHEVHHGIKYPGEEKRWGKYWGMGRELMATDMAVEVSAYNPRLNRSVIKGTLSFALDDVSVFAGRVFNGFGDNQPTLEEIINFERNGFASDYAVAGYILLRQAYLSGALKRMDMEAITRLSSYRARDLLTIARGGSEDEAERLFRFYLDERRSYPGYNINPDKHSNNNSVAQPVSA